MLTWYDNDCGFDDKPPPRWLYVVLFFMVCAYIFLSFRSGR